jgi:Ser/Thr protein kinase RdoA (MazF antagonist)
VIPQRVAKEISILFGTNASPSLIQDRGLSKAMVYRIDTPALRCAMKRWPVSMEQEWLLRIHRFQDFLSEDPQVITPGLLKWSNGKTLLEADGVFWSIEDWKSGLPIDRLGQASDEQILRCAESLANMHLRSESYGVEVRIAPGLKQRHENLLHAVRPPNDQRRRFLDSITTHSESLAASILNDIYLRAMCCIPSVIDTIQRLSETPVTCFWILRDIWRQHILYREQRISGFIDFGAARIDWPGLDLVRALGTLMLASDPRWPKALARYLEKRPDGSLVIESLKSVHQASVALSALQWLDWFAVGQFDWTNRSSQVWNRVLELQQLLMDFETDDGSLWR